MASYDHTPVILSAARTPTGRFLGTLKGIPAPRLGATVLKAAVERAGIKDAAEIDEVFMGNVVSAGLDLKLWAQPLLIKFVDRD